MKKTFPANINGSIFYIDEDAYNLLNTYLDQLRNAFPGEEGDEISSDIEGRISEHFTERINEGARVITIDDVNRIIKVMGEPAELASDTADGTRSAAAQTPGAPGAPVTPPPFHGTGYPQAGTVRKRLYRNPNNSVFGGVIGGLGVYLGWNVNLMRLLLVVLALCTYFWPCVLAYLIAWMVIPCANTPRQLLEMNGTPVTPGSVGQAILGTADPEGQKINSGSALTNFFKIAGNIILAFFGLIAGCIGLGFLALFFFMLCALVMYLGWNDITLLAAVDFQTFVHPAIAITGILCLSLAIVLPCAALVWAACCALFQASSASRATIISGIIIEVILIVATIVLIESSHLADTLPSELMSTISFSSQLLTA